MRPGVQVLFIVAALLVWGLLSWFWGNFAYSLFWRFLEQRFNLQEATVTAFVLRQLPPLIPPLLIIIFGGFIYGWWQHFLGTDSQKPAAAAVQDDYAYALELERVDFEDFRQLDKKTDRVIARSGRFALYFRNTISKPIRYEVKRVVVDGIEQADFASRGAVIGSQSSAVFYTEKTKLDPTKLQDALNSGVEIDIGYGSPEHGSRLVKKAMRVESYVSSGKSTFLYDKNEDVPFVLGDAYSASPSIYAALKPVTPRAPAAKGITGQLIVKDSPGSIIAPSGGVNTVNNTFQKSPTPHLDGDAKVKLQELIKKDGHQVLVMGQSGNSPSMNLASEIYDYLKGAGYPMKMEEASWHMFGGMSPNSVSASLANNGTEWWVTVGPME